MTIKQQKEYFPVSRFLGTCFPYTECPYMIQNGFQFPTCTITEFLYFKLLCLPNQKIHKVVYFSILPRFVFFMWK